MSERIRSGLDHGPLHDLLTALAKEHNHISIRLQLGGALWTEHFSRVLVYSSRAFLLTHMPTRSVINIPDVNQVTGFEIDHPYRLFLSNRPYEVDPVLRRIKVKRDGLLHA